MYMNNTELESKPLTPFFARVGNKKKIKNIIIDLIPTHQIYVEPFFGSGAIFFNKQPCKIEIINDLDTQLINGYKYLKNITEIDVVNIK